MDKDYKAPTTEAQWDTDCLIPCSWAAMAIWASSSVATHHDGTILFGPRHHFHF
jgi:hypothetical protein